MFRRRSLFAPGKLMPAPTNQDYVCFSAFFFLFCFNSCWSPHREKCAVDIACCGRGRRRRAATGASCGGRSLAFPAPARRSWSRRSQPDDGDGKRRRATTRRHGRLSPGSGECSSTSRFLFLFLIRQQRGVALGARVDSPVRMSTHEPIEDMILRPPTAYFSLILTLPRLPPYHSTI